MRFSVFGWCGYGRFQMIQTVKVTLVFANAMVHYNFCWFTLFFFLVWFGNVDNIFYDVAVSSVTVLLMVCLSVCFLTNNNSCYYNETFGFSSFRSVSVWHRWVYCITDIYFLLMSLGVKDFKMGFSVFWWCGIWDFSWLSILEKHTYTLWYWKLWVLLKSTQWQFFLLLQ